ncbi:MAG: RNA 3'-terminal phosphate cyclase, partial [Nitrospirae bacterium]|nr:RNA 3'-terminal phosphate cyclase [Nitrospirota bacterium]
MLRIDGSYGEGGGQILRTALALSCVTGQPFTLYNIRKGRPKPGLQPQHLTCVRAAQTVTAARVTGEVLGSTQLTFEPGPVRPGEYRFDVAETRGSAGSVTLVLQTLLLPLALASDRQAPFPLPPGGGGRRRVGGESTSSQITVLGGTHVPWSPPAHYLREVFFPLLARLGIHATLEIRRWGWYPQGGGEVAVRIQPTTAIAPLNWEQGGEVKRIFGVSAAANLPRSIAERQRDRALAVLRAKGLEARIAIEEAPSPGKGTIFFLAAEREQGWGGASALGAIGKRA